MLTREPGQLLIGAQLWLGCPGCQSHFSALPWCAAWPLSLIEKFFLNFIDFLMETSVRKARGT
ncbi:hypothetical protein CSB45_13185 [candidate division KSB3 bacterium]|uniref:Uncharacterized protein n=1 Tax=candidate division KSB3 bacterium TaxID=2044937 RepID=A0A2G6E2U0_9BACT|nr:MAG: hypothetical protein CSB45_13185 [candidate division KSB3 bacterium]PIE28652.1 MAG: hypothetical protein CSA57_12840 [candidate division KSB3 bacterium]